MDQREISVWKRGWNCVAFEKEEGIRVTFTYDPLIPSDWINQLNFGGAIIDNLCIRALVPGAGQKRSEYHVNVF